MVQDIVLAPLARNDLEELIADPFIVSGNCQTVGGISGREDCRQSIFRHSVLFRACRRVPCSPSTLVEGHGLGT